MRHEKILFLGPEESPLYRWLQEQSESVSQTSDKIKAQFIEDEKFTFLISYGYRHIIRREILDKFPSKAINLHISYLPWNRGSDPNFWSFVEDTPKGVTIHYLDEGVGTGDIIVQKELSFDSNNETLATSYEKLQSAIQELFKKHWYDIKSGSYQRQKQVGKGSSHKLKDKEPFSDLLTEGWNTPVSVLEEYCGDTQLSIQFFEKWASEICEMKKQNEERG